MYECVIFLNCSHGSLPMFTNDNIQIDPVLACDVARMMGLDAGLCNMLKSFYLNQVRTLEINGESMGELPGRPLIPPVLPRAPPRGILPGGPPCRNSLDAASGNSPRVALHQESSPKSPHQGMKGRKEGSPPPLPSDSAP